jgi:hypothetical protein
VSFGKRIGEQGYAEMGYRTPEVGVGVATWAIRREWAMTHWRESANLSLCFFFRKDVFIMNSGNCFVVGLGVCKYP